MKEKNEEETPEMTLYRKTIDDMQIIDKGVIMLILIFMLLVLFGVTQSILAWKIFNIEDYLSEKKCEIPLQNAPTTNAINATVG